MVFKKGDRVRLGAVLSEETKAKIAKSHLGMKKPWISRANTGRHASKETLLKLSIARTGERNGRWKGAEANYTNKHKRVAKTRGKPPKCSACDREGEFEGRYEWANLSGDFDNLNDYVRLCTPCHRLLDIRLRKLR